MLVYQRVVPLDFFEHPPGLLSWYQNTHTHTHAHICCTYIYIYRFLICFYFLYVILPAYIFTCLHSAYMYNVCIYMCIFMYIYILCRYPLAIKRVNGTMAHHLPVSLVSSDWVNSGSLMFSIISSY